MSNIFFSKSNKTFRPKRNVKERFQLRVGGVEKLETKLTQ